jgi:hypothetical protein
LKTKAIAGKCTVASSGRIVATVADQKAAMARSPGPTVHNKFFTFLGQAACRDWFTGHGKVLGGLKWLSDR